LADWVEYLSDLSGIFQGGLCFIFGEFPDLENVRNICPNQTINKAFSGADLTPMPTVMGAFGTMNVSADNKPWNGYLSSWYLFVWHPKDKGHRITSRFYLLVGEQIVWFLRTCWEAEVCERSGE